MQRLRFVLLALIIVTASSLAGEPLAEEKAALEAILPTFQTAWNSGKIADLLALFDPNGRMRKAYDTNADAKTAIETDFAAMVADFGAIKSSEIRVYIERKTRWVVRTTYEKEGVLAGTFAVAKDADGKWWITDLNVDGQGEPELEQ
jgi:hypothetical protein